MTGKAGQPGEKIDSLEETMALESVSHSLGS